MKKKFFTDLKVGDKVYRLDDKTVTENGVEELTADSVDIINGRLVVKCGDKTLINWPISQLDECELIHDYDEDDNWFYYGASRESVVRDFNRGIDSEIDYYESEINRIKDVIEKLKSQKLPL